MNLAYDDRGRGDPVLFIAGRGGAGRTWHLHQVPEFVRAYDEDGMTIDEFERYGATVRTLRQFLEADAQLDALVRDILIPPV